MRRLISVVVLIAFNCIVILAQQTDKQNIRPTTPLPTGLAASDAPPDAAAFQLSVPRFTFGQSQSNNLIIRLSGQSTEEVSPFVVIKGAVYMRLPGDQSSRKHLT